MREWRVEHVEVAGHAGVMRVQDEAKSKVGCKK